MLAQPLIRCRDVLASSLWYQRLLGCVGGYGGAEYEQLWDPRVHASKWGSDGLILQLHAWEVDHHHGALGDPTRVLGGAGVALEELDGATLEERHEGRSGGVVVQRAPEVRRSRHRRRG